LGNNPAVIEYFENGKIKFAEYLENGENVLKPGMFYDNITYKMKPVYHKYKEELETMDERIFNTYPICRVYNHLGKVIRIEYYHKNEIDMPTLIIYDPTGESIIKEIWRTVIQGKKEYHRENGPAKILYDPFTKKPFLKEYYLKGNHIRTEYC